MGLLAGGWAWFAVLPLLAKRPRPLKPKAALLLKIIKNRPGIGTDELAKTAKMGWGSLYLHLRSLHARRLIARRSKGPYVSWFPAGGKVPARPLRLDIRARPIARLLAQTPGKDAAEYAKMLPVPRRTTYYHIKKLVESGLLKSKEKGRYVGLEPTQKLLEMLDLPDQ